MALGVEFLLGAEIDFLEAYASRGESFQEDVDQTLARLAQFPEVGPIYSAPFRRILVPNSPYGIFYVIESSRIFIHAILDLRRDSPRISDRLKS